MKKKRLLLFIAPIFLLIFLIGPYKNRTYIQSKFFFTKTFHHERNKFNTAVFDGYQVNIGGYKLIFETSIYSREKAALLLNVVQKDLCKIHDESQMRSTGIIYVVPVDWHINSDEKGCIYTTEKEIKSGKYLEQFSAMFMSCKGEWKRLAFASIIRNDKQNKKDISRILLDSHYKDMLKLCPLFLDKRSYPYYDSARKVAIDFGFWLYDKYGFDEFLESRGERIPKYYTEYTGKKTNLRINANYKNGTELYLKNGDELIISNGNITVQFSKQFKIDLEDNYKTLCACLTMSDRLKSLIIEKKLTSKKKNELLKNIYFYCSGDGDKCTSSKEKILLVNGGFSFNIMMHELAHSYLEPEFRSENAWLVEGMAVYIEALLEQEAYESGLISQSSCQSYNRRNDRTREECEFLDLVVKKYIEKGGKDFTKGDFDFPLYYKCAAAVQLFVELDKDTNLSKTSAFGSVSNSHGYDKNLKILNNITYFQAGTLVDYLVKQGRQKQMIQFAETGKSFKECFGCTEEDMLELFKSWIIKDYGIMDRGK